ncbi:hypothetical protein [Dehalobacter sp.]|uniref:hypothetical protein n=1 Tax=Dehalobacter sp. TaxID=1962289 RepID=UPI00036E1575|nr:hypothetical protein [Dehalobacter sp.]MDJ0304556.1 hypothetical protein [Dehalobacter sp.]
MFGLKKKQINHGSVIAQIEGTERVEIYPILEERDGLIDCGDMAFPIAVCTEKFSSSGERFLLVNLSRLGVVEAQEIKSIRESQVIKGLFESPVEKRLPDYIPIVVCGLVALVALIIR